MDGSSGFNGGNSMVSRQAAAVKGVGWKVDLRDEGNGGTGSILAKNRNGLKNNALSNAIRWL